MIRNSKEYIDFSLTLDLTKERAREILIEVLVSMTMNYKRTETSEESIKHFQQKILPELSFITTPPEILVMAAAYEFLNFLNVLESFVATLNMNIEESHIPDAEMRDSLHRMAQKIFLFEEFQ